MICVRLCYLVFQTQILNIQIFKVYADNVLQRFFINMDNIETYGLEYVSLQLVILVNNLMQEFQFVHVQNTPLILM